MENEKYSEILSDDFSRDNQNSKYLDVPKLFRETSSDQPLSLGSDNTASTDTTTEMSWRDLLARPVRAEEASVYDNPIILSQG